MDLCLVPPPPCVSFSTCVASVAGDTGEAKEQNDVARAAEAATKGAQSLQPIHLEVSRASAGAIEAIEAQGGTVTCAHFNRLALRALVSDAVAAALLACWCCLLSWSDNVIGERICRNNGSSRWYLTWSLCRLLGTSCLDVETPCRLLSFVALVSVAPAVRLRAGVRSQLKPEKFEELPRRARPPPRLMPFYLDYGRRGYLSPEVSVRFICLSSSIESCGYAWKR